VQTNIVIFDLVPPLTPQIFLEYLKLNGLIASAFGPRTIRFVTHLDVTREMVERAVDCCRRFRAND
jgi:threonine aldolase